MCCTMTLSVVLLLVCLSFDQLVLSAVVESLIQPLHGSADQPMAAAVDNSATKTVSDIDSDSVAPGSDVAVIKEPVPLGAYAVFDHHGHICILITLTVEFQIIYFNEYGERKKASLPLPNNASASGSCARDGEKPKIIFSWGSFRFAILFRQNEFGNTWFVSDMRLFYDLDDRLFIESKSGSGIQSARMDVEAQHVLKLFASPVDKAYFCTSEQDLELLDATGTQTATILLRDVHIQPYVNNGQFGPSVNCPGGKVGRRKINETVPLAVGSTLACVTIATIAGYALWRYVKVKKFVYGTME